MHPLGPIWEGVEHIRAASHQCADLPRLRESPVAQSFPLARVGQTVASSACKEPIGAVEQRSTAPTVLAVAIDVAAKPWTATAQVTRRPRERHPLLDVFPSLGPLIHANADPGRETVPGNMVAGKSSPFGKVGSLKSPGCPDKGQ